jgi:hypothetical protein
MKIIVIGGSGLSGSKLAGTLRARSHEALAISPNAAAMIVHISKTLRTSAASSRGGARPICFVYTQGSRQQHRRQKRESLKLHTKNKGDRKCRMPCSLMI